MADEKTTTAHERPDAGTVETTGKRRSSVSPSVGHSWAPFVMSLYHVTILLGSIYVTTYVIGPSALVRCDPQVSTGITPTAGSVVSAACVPQDGLVIAFAFCFGALGSALTASRYVVYAVRYRKYDRNRVLWQLLTPIHGGVLAIMGVYVAVGGLLALAQNPTIGNQYGYFIGGFSFLVGFSSELFVKRLISATEALFGESKNIESVSAGADDRKDESGSRTDSGKLGGGNA